MHVLGEAGLDTSSEEAITASLRTVAHDRSSYADVWGLAEALLEHDELAAAWRARHVVMVERMIGAKTGTGVHQWTHKDMMIRPNMGDPTQLDCIDEAVNTWTYMTMMERAGLFRFHHVTDLAYAGLPTDTNPRNTAVLRAKDGGYYAVDASLVDGGVPPMVMPLSVWTGSWPPELADVENAAKPAKTAALARD